ncbi:hypothetical protein [Skermanella aerolata]|uniref:hypothetical protein n=1 Tax=Skermanella aerolata TaxID=393310 RepID=UPI0011BF81EF|nr:hypothetical protein [Skermanella aerolata]
MNLDAVSGLVAADADQLEFRKDHAGPIGILEYRQHPSERPCVILADHGGFQNFTAPDDPDLR